jgi:ribosomal protein S6--L-glutamate ligase
VPAIYNGGVRICILSRRASLYSTSRLIQAAEAHGHEVYVADPLACYLLVERDNPRIYHGPEEVSDFDVVIPRIGASITEYGLAVVNQYETLGVPVVNGSAAIARARDKLKCMQLLAQRGLPVPNTLMARDPEHIHEFLKRVGGTPVVLKLLQGTQGVGVMLAETPESLESILDTLWGMGQNILIQQFISEARGKDLRLLVIGDEVVAAMRRYARGKEFRANIHRGGAGSAARPTPQARSLAVEATQILGLAVAGVDLIETSKGPLILEVNASPGFEELERATRVDVASKIIAFAASIATRLRAVG